MAVAGELGVEGMEELVVVQGQYLPLECGAFLRGEDVETAKVEFGPVSHAGSVAKSSGDNPVIMAAVRANLEEHGTGTNALATYPPFRVTTVEMARTGWSGGNPSFEAIATHRHPPRKLFYSVPRVERATSLVKWRRSTCKVQSPCLPP